MIRAHGDPHDPSVPTGNRRRGRHGTLLGSMALDPSTPVIVGVGQVTNRPDPEGGGSLAERPEPIGLMVDAVRCRGGGLRRRRARAGRPRPAAGCSAAIQSLRVANPLSWHYEQPRAAGGRGPGHRAGPADGDHHRREQPPEPGQRHRPGHRPGPAGRGRAGRGGLRLHPGRRPPSPRPTPAALDGAAGRTRRPPVFGNDRRAHHRRRGGAGPRPAHPCLPAVRERPAGRGRPLPG